MVQGGEGRVMEINFAKSAERQYRKTRFDLVTMSEYKDRIYHLKGSPFEIGCALRSSSFERCDDPGGINSPTPPSGLSK